ncbi:hypothetical protein ACFE04_016462 [Oxalis oulophora]
MDEKVGQMVLLVIVGGWCVLADYCTYYVPYLDGSCTNPGKARSPDRMLGQVREANWRTDDYPTWDSIINDVNLYDITHLSLVELSFVRWSVLPSLTYPLVKNKSAAKKTPY